MIKLHDLAFPSRKKSWSCHLGTNVVQVQGMGIKKKRSHQEAGFELEQLSSKPAEPATEAHYLLLLFQSMVRSKLEAVE